ncbi:geranylgeranyl transferase type-1 subunit beta-like [Corticium candelabrum]|uniref:geranylgeranyl transferase type-1 subunit beta-like n=1 Tax=Corticium candelabrum TaxID=121492 RepID=UPI002E273F67|nr:geranylgeranyl transferase type-1 subunit beta-like [Corticium candelabrum]
MATKVESILLREKHVKFFMRCLSILPDRYEAYDSNRMTICFFALSGLDLLDALDRIDSDKQSIIDWIYSLQVLPSSKELNESPSKYCGFRGSKAAGAKSAASIDDCPYDGGHLAMTYTALASLLILQDDFSRVHRSAIIQSLKSLQRSDGSFSPMAFECENDVRFIYCVCCISYMLNDWSGFDQEKAVDYIRNSQGYDFGIAQGPSMESHGGSTFCAVASLFLMGRLHDAFAADKLEGLKRWCLLRQQTGFNGRPNKPVDTCYSFWVGATLELLGCYDLIDRECNRGHLLAIQNSITGGLSKHFDTPPDVLHSYLGLSGLSLLSEPGLQEVDPALNISRRAVEHLHTTCW